MGDRTYRQIVTELSPGSWPYKDKTSYIITHRRESAPREIIFTAEAPEKLLAGLKDGAGRDIWICGGADVANQLIEHDLIDRYWITVAPILLGDGIRLFERRGGLKPLRLVAAERYNGMTDLVYDRR